MRKVRELNGKNGAYTQRQEQRNSKDKVETYMLKHDILKQMKQVNKHQ